MKAKNPNRQSTAGGSATGQQMPEVGGLTFGQDLGARDEMFTREEMAAKLKVTVRSIENWQHDGFLPYIKIGNALWFYWPDVVQHFLTHFRTLRVAAPLANTAVAVPHALPPKGGAQ